MNTKDALENYYYSSGKLSEIARQLAFAGLALVWIFRTTVNERQIIPAQLYSATVWFVTTLLLDFGHYLAATLVWGAFHRRKEKRVGPEDEFLAPRSLNWPALSFFWLKVVAIAVAYVHVYRYLATVVRVG